MHSYSVSMQPKSYSTDTKDRLFLPNVVRSNYGKYLRAERYCAIEAVCLYMLVVCSMSFRTPKIICKIYVFLFSIIFISNSNWTELSTIQGVIARVISKSDEREARGRFEITSTITP